MSAPVAALYAAGVIPAGAHVLDVGCGTGEDALALADWGPVRVVGVDLDASRIAVARRRAARRGVADRVRFEARSALDLSEAWPAASFDVVVDTLCYNNIPPDRKRRYVREVAHVLRAGGVYVQQARVAASDFVRGPLRVPGFDALERFFEMSWSYPTHIPEAPQRARAPPYARVGVCVGRRNDVPADTPRGT